MKCIDYLNTQKLILVKQNNLVFYKEIISVTDKVKRHKQKVELTNPGPF